MDSVPQQLNLIVSLRNGIAQGVSVRTSLEQFLGQNTSSDLRHIHRLFLNLKEGRLFLEDSAASLTLSSMDAQIVQLILRGVRGEAIAQALEEVEKEILEQCEHDIDCFASRLPPRLMAILAVFGFPAVMLVMIGPLISDLFQMY